MVAISEGHVHINAMSHFSNRYHISARIGIIIGIFLMLVGCTERGLSLDDLPTPITPEARATELVLTRNAPPTGFEQVAFPMVDDNLSTLPGWRYELLMSFNGVFAGTPRQTQATTRATVWYNQVASSRRIVLQSEGELLTEGEPINLEAVRLGQDAFLLRDGVCLVNAQEEAQVAAELGAGTLIGGVNNALPAARKATINSEAVWEYALNFEQLNLPALDFSDGGQVLAMNGELWVAPEHNAVVRYYLTLEVENARVFGSTLPLTGTVIIRYDLYDVGIAPNLSVPFGC